MRSNAVAALLAIVGTEAHLRSLSVDWTSYTDPVGPDDPWGIHVAYGNDGTSEALVMWTTRNSVNFSVVQAGVLADAPYSNWPLTFSGDVIPFSDVGNVQTLHRVHMTGLQPGTSYAYRVGDGADNWSDVFNFSTQPRADSGWLPVIAVYGDMGITSNADDTMPWLIEDARSGAFDFVLHIGDMAYNLDSNNGATGDAWMNLVQPVATIVPYHVCPGNHESATDFYEYRMRMGAGMPTANSPSSGGNGTFYSFNAGPVHVIMISSEVYFSVQPHSMGLMIEQAEWLQADLAAVNRTATPFVILGLHQPFYCSPNDDQDDCHEGLSLVRLGLESIIHEGGVDMVFGAHEHSYERNYPVYNSTWNGQTGAGAYVNPPATVHILSGAAGCPEDQDGWQSAGNPWSAARINDYGYGRLHVVNRTVGHGGALYWEYIDNQQGKVLDSMTLIKDSDGPSFPPHAARAWRDP